MPLTLNASGRGWLEVGRVYENMEERAAGQG
jgi:hypothetical protein